MKRFIGQKRGIRLYVEAWILSWFPGHFFSYSFFTFSGYLKQARLWHPDKRGGSAEAEDRFKAISDAYKVQYEL